jgi:hypothetical protein
MIKRVSVEIYREYLRLLSPDLLLMYDIQRRINGK